MSSRALTWLKSRLSKWLGDFGEGLVVYALALNGWYVTRVDDIGADVQAQKEGVRWGISVKFRLFRAGSSESRMVTISDRHLRNLRNYCERYGLRAAYAQVVSIEDESTIHLIILPVETIEQHLPRTANGYSLRFSRKRLSDLFALPGLYYQTFKHQLLLRGEFGQP